MRSLSLLCYIISILGFILFGYSYFKQAPSKQNLHNVEKYKLKKNLDKNKIPLSNNLALKESPITNDKSKDNQESTNNEVELNQEEIQNLLQESLKDGFELDKTYKTKEASFKVKEHIDTNKSITTHINKTFITEDGKEIHIESMEQTSNTIPEQSKGSPGTDEKIKAWQVLLNNYDTDENINKLCDNLNKGNQDLGLKLFGKISTELDLATVKRINKCFISHAMDSNNFYEFINSFLQGSDSTGFNLLKTIVCEQSTRLDDRILSQNLNLKLLKMSQIDKLFLSYLFKCNLNAQEFSTQSDTDQCVAIFPTAKTTFCSLVVLN